MKFDLSKITTVSNVRLCLIYTAFIVALLPLMIFRDFTPDNELRYLCIADESIASGRFFAFTDNGVPYADKPPLYLWIVMLCRLIAGSHQMWLLSLFSIIPAIITSAVMARMAQAYFNRNEVAGAVAMLLTTTFFLALSVTLRMDMLMTMFIVLAFYSFTRIEKRKRTKDQWMFGVWVFLAVFSKGPIGILVPLLTIAVYCGIKRNLKLFTEVWSRRAWCVLILCCAVWFTMVFVEGGTSYLDNLLFHQTMGRAVNSFHHSRPFWYYAGCIWYVAAPWSLFAIVMIIVALKNTRSLSDFGLLCVIEFVCTFVMLSFISGKLQVYLLPSLPFLIFGAWEVMRQLHKWQLGRILIAIPIAVSVSAVGIYFLLPKIPDIPQVVLNNKFVLEGCVILSVVSLISLIKIFKVRKPDNLVTGLIYYYYAILCFIYNASVVVPSLTPYIGWKDLALTAKEVANLYSISERDMLWVDIERSSNASVLLDGNVPAQLTLTSRKDEPDEKKRDEKDRLKVQTALENLSCKTVVVTKEKNLHLFSPTRIEHIGDYVVFTVSPSIPKSKTK